MLVACLVRVSGQGIRPLKYYMDFVNDFSDFQAGMIPQYDRVLLVGDFNIHVRCPDKPLVKDLLSLIDSLYLVQCLSGPTHEHGHTLILFSPTDCLCLAWTLATMYFLYVCSV